MDEPTNHSAFENAGSAIYDFFRRRFQGTGLSKYSFVRNLNYKVKKLLYRKPGDFIFTGGFKFYLDQRKVFSEIVFEGPEVEQMTRFLHPGDIVVDVGANIGWFSLIASRAVGETGKVFAFEPVHAAYDVLQKNIRENHCDNVTPENAAISDRSGAGVVYTVGNLWHGSSLVDPTKDADFWITPHLSDFEDKTIHRSEVPQKTLDEICGDRHIDFIKIDTEGNDGKVWAGMRGIVRNNTSIVILMEFSPTLLRKNGTEPDELVRDIRSTGLNIFTIDQSGVKPFKDDPDFSGDLILSRNSVSDLSSNTVK